MLVGTAVAGPAWIWVLPVALAGQCLLLAVYSELASEFPIAGGAYQWSRRLIGGAYGWFNGWVAICAYAAANTTIAYLGRAVGADPARHRADPARDRRGRHGAGAWSARSSARSGSTSSRGPSRPGSPPRSLASVGIGLALLLVFREQDLSILGDTLGAEALSGGSALAAMLAALAVGGWVFIGFDALRRRSPRRRATPHATSRARSGSRCSASARW